MSMEQKHFSTQRKHSPGIWADTDMRRTSKPRQAKNPNSSPTGKKFGFLTFGGGRWIRWLALHSKAIRIKPVCELVFPTGHWPVGLRLVRICLSATKKAPPKAMSFCWWGKVDSNHRSYKQQIYSLSPLATREFPQIFSSCRNLFMIPHILQIVKHFFWNF